MPACRCRLPSLSECEGRGGDEEPAIRSEARLTIEREGERRQEQRSTENRGGEENGTENGGAEMSVDICHIMVAVGLDHNIPPGVRWEV